MADLVPAGEHQPARVPLSCFRSRMVYLVWMTSGGSGVIYVIKSGLQWKDRPNTCSAATNHHDAAQCILHNPGSQPGGRRCASRQNVCFCQSAPSWVWVEHSLLHLAWIGPRIRDPATAQPAMSHLQIVAVLPIAAI